MKLILVAKADLKDGRNSVGTITLGSNFKMNIHANFKMDIHSAPLLNKFNFLIQEIKLLKKRKGLIMNNPINFYALHITDQVYARLQEKSAAEMELADVNLPVGDYHLIGYIQAHNNRRFSVVLNNDFADNENELFAQLVDLSKQLSIDNKVAISYQHLGYCPKLAKNRMLGKDLYKTAPDKASVNDTKMKDHSAPTHTRSRLKKK